MNHLPPKEFYTTYEAGSRLFVSHSTVIDWIESGKLKAVKTLGGHRRIPREELERFMARHKMVSEQKKKPAILIVDDDQSIREGLKEILQKEGFKTYAASEGFEAGVSAIQYEPGLIILDIKMPGLDGFNACRLIKSNPLLKKIKILILTGYPTKPNIAKILKMGADRCLAKPVQTKILLNEISLLLELKNKA
ncbi:MAG: response regulator [Candidatus Omnitrophota bacterium]